MLGIKEILKRLDNIDKNVEKVNERLELIEEDYDYLNRELLSETEIEAINTHLNYERR